MSSEMQAFDFGFGGGKAVLGVPPDRQTMAGYRAGNGGINSVRPSLEYSISRVASAGSVQPDSLQTIDARHWNPSTLFGARSASRAVSAGTRHSVQDYGSILGKRFQYESLADQLERGSPPPRPASVASGNPYQFDMIPAFAPVRLSAGSADSPRRGHRRQNCVRITNLPSIESRSRVAPMPEVAEEQPEAAPVPVVKIPGLELLEVSQPTLRARASLVDIKASPSPMRNRPILLPTRPRGHQRTSTNDSGRPRPDSDIFSTAQPSPITPTNFHSASQLPLSPTPPGSIKMNTPSPRDSPILPSPMYGSCPRKSLVKGPRTQPLSARERNGSPSPASQRYAQKRLELDLRKSVAMLRSMNSEGRLLDLHNRTYRNIGLGDENVYSGASLTSLYSFLAPGETRHSTNCATSRSKMNMTMSPSNNSLAAASIWEDASVRADSPEPEMPTLGQEVLSYGPQTPTVKASPDPEAYENIYVANKGRLRNMYESPKGKGLGIIGPNGNTIGTPGSLYDRDGFLKD
jgi:hypothetical protein